MTQSLNIQEISLVLQAANLDPAILNPSLFDYSAIFPTDWEVLRQPVYQRNGVQILFKNGIRLIVQPNRLTLSELVLGKEIHEMQVATLMSKWIEALPNLEYQALGINPTGMMSFPEEEQGTANFLRSVLLTDRVQREGLPELSMAALNLSYRLERGMLNLSIQEGTAQRSGNQAISALLYSGNCHYTLQGGSRSERLDDLRGLLDQWQSGVDQYRDLVSYKLLQLPELVSA